MLDYYQFQKEEMSIPLSFEECNEYDNVFAEINRIEQIYDIEDIEPEKDISELIELCEEKEMDILPTHNEWNEYIQIFAVDNKYEQINLHEIFSRKLSELIEIYEDIQSIPYYEILSTSEWRKRRIQIIDRDKARCTNCGPVRSVQLHVHHRYYIKNNLPWEYGDDALITLCEVCHHDLHLNSKIPIYSIIKGKLEELDYTPCTRCDGAGWIERYRHVQGGICFRCYGKKYEQLIDSDEYDFTTKCNDLKIKD